MTEVNHITRTPGRHWEVTARRLLQDPLENKPGQQSLRAFGDQELRLTLNFQFSNKHLNLFTLGCECKFTACIGYEFSLT